MRTSLPSRCVLLRGLHYIYTHTQSVRHRLKQPIQHDYDSSRKQLKCVANSDLPPPFPVDECNLIIYVILHSYTCVHHCLTCTLFCFSLVCAVNYNPPSGDSMYFRKFFKFQVFVFILHTVSIYVYSSALMLRIGTCIFFWKNDWSTYLSSYFHHPNVSTVMICWFNSILFIMNSKRTINLTILIF